ncbi:hypothetical protein L596_021287 [Steinernema carpocapsae]|uniref:Uncharacterized protein n=1 Tax=Steinernema carpocapsae TaxID=34508 RepID=A0A4U5MI89_STECR|nr:hypothetical protein L596_021287 [Steinernema carpocapsae]
MLRLLFILYSVKHGSRSSYWTHRPRRDHLRPLLAFPICQQGGHFREGFGRNESSSSSRKAEEKEAEQGYQEGIAEARQEQASEGDQEGKEGREEGCC